MKYETTDDLHLRAEPNLSGVILQTLSKGTVLDGDGSSPWASVTLADGTKGFCSAEYLQAVLESPLVTQKIWSMPVSQKYFVLSQNYLDEDWTLYPKFGHHTGVDYGGHGVADIPLFACADGEIVYRAVADSAWGAILGNHAALYVPSVDRSFLYCHMASEPHALGGVKVGEQIGIMGNTGTSANGAIHLHLEGFYGRFDIAERSFTSLDGIIRKTFDAHAFIVSHL